VLEAASVTAFRVLERDLARLRAPRRLLRAVRRAARDEQRHTRATSSLARRFGTHPRAPQTKPTPERNLFELALDNAVEGCVRETFGALVAIHQAHNARDLQVRATMQRIAVEETSHAALSWELARWFEQRLQPAQCQHIRQAMQAATRDLRRELASEPLPDAEAIGLPTVARSLELLAELDARLLQRA
jgi:hypothetical protein